MKQIIEKLSFNTKAENVLEITNEIFDSINSFNLSSGLINLSVLHTSCSLMVQENADSSVLLDIKNFLNKIAPECDSYNHSTEGPDDMPAHIKSALTLTSVSIPFVDGSLGLGTWQAVYLWEHRAEMPGVRLDRKLLVHVSG